MKQLSAIILILSINLSFCYSAFSQAPVKDTTSVDYLFQKARNLAFNKQRAEARAICRQILLKSPDYTDVRVLIGRTYEWDNKPDSARIELKKVINKGYYEDAVSALIDVETWEDRTDSALFYADLALKHNPNNEEILLKKAKLLIKKGDEPGAVSVLKQILDNINPSNKEARDLLESLKAAKMYNRIELGWSNEYFDEKLGASWIRNWNVYTLGYSHRFPKVGNIFFKTNLGTMNTDKRVSKQFDIDIYTNGGIFKKEYFNLSYGYSPEDRYFPRHHAGVELYQSLPHAWEASIGVRLLAFYGSPNFRYFREVNRILTEPIGGGSGIYIFTGSIGKYWKNYWFSLRPYVTPSRKYFKIANKFEEKVSVSLYLSARYYFATSNDYLSLTIGAGQGPNYVNTFMNSVEINRSQSISAGYSHIFKKRILFLASFGIFHDEYKRSPSKYRIELDPSLKIAYYF